MCRQSGVTHSSFVTPVSHSLSLTTARNMKLSKAFTFYVSIFLFFLSPSLLRLYPGPYTTPLADVVDWLGNKVTQAIAALALLAALTLGSSLTYDTYRWLTGGAAPVPATPSPTELEEGTATTPEAQSVAVEANAESTPAAAAVPVSSKKSKQPTLAGKIGGFLFSSGFVAFDLFTTNGLISSSKPLVENVGDVLLYLLRGWEALFLIMTLACAMAWVHKRYLAPAAVTQAAAPEVLFEGTLPEENENAEKQTEKA
ncbi:hypothetical protein MSAN_00844100 [Mycena sanguinolenta]|uniref:Uncharacterized protein n=1 Tax=Mycena sanguinolenta TaxID=230812 RepID=A0A8H6YYV6_9AGAR|nr:hypothetical protein MSAN_00844100 [Mycena sanguinolenta]